MTVLKIGPLSYGKLVGEYDRLDEMDQNVDLMSYVAWFMAFLALVPAWYVARNDQFILHTILTVLFALWVYLIVITAQWGLDTFISFWRTRMNMFERIKRCLIGTLKCTMWILFLLELFLMLDALNTPLFGNETSKLSWLLRYLG